MWLDVLDCEARTFLKEGGTGTPAGTEKHKPVAPSESGVEKNGHLLTMRLSLPVIRILADDDNLDLAKRCVGPCVDIAGCVSRRLSRSVVDGINRALYLRGG
jgi:hypothetical protein